MEKEHSVAESDKTAVLIKEEYMLIIKEASKVANFHL